MFERGGDRESMGWVEDPSKEEGEDGGAVIHSVCEGNGVLGLTAVGAISH